MLVFRHAVYLGCTDMHNSTRGVEVDCDCCRYVRQAECHLHDNDEIFTTFRKGSEICSVTFGKEDADAMT
jgi:hypothetical protein